MEVAARWKRGSHYAAKVIEIYTGETPGSSDLSTTQTTNKPTKTSETKARKKKTESSEPEDVQSLVKKKKKEIQEEKRIQKNAQAISAQNLANKLFAKSDNLILATSQPVPLTSTPTTSHLMLAAPHPVPASSHPVPASSHPVPDSPHPMPAFSHTVPASLHQVPASSHPVPASYHPVPDSPHPVPASPHPVSASSHPVPALSHAVPDSPHPVPASSNAVPDSPHLVPASSHPMPASSNAVPDSPHPAPASSNAVPDSPYPVPVSSHPVPASSHVVTVSSHPVPASSNAVPDSPHPVPVSSHPVPASSHVVKDFPHPVPASSNAVPDSPHLVPASSHPVPETSYTASISLHPVPFTSHPIPASSVPDSLNPASATCTSYSVPTTFHSTPAIPYGTWASPLHTYLPDRRYAYGFSSQHLTFSPFSVSHFEESSNRNMMPSTSQLLDISNNFISSSFKVVENISSDEDGGPSSPQLSLPSTSQTIHPECPDCLRKDKEIWELKKEIERLKNEKRFSKHLMEEEEGKETHRKRHNPKNRPEISFADYILLSKGNPVQSGYHELAPGAPIAVKSLWLHEVLSTPRNNRTKREKKAARKGKTLADNRNAEVIKRLMDGFYDPWDLNSKGGTLNFTSDPVYLSLKLYAEHVLKMSTPEFKRAWNTKLASARFFVKKAAAKTTSSGKDTQNDSRDTDISDKSDEEINVADT